VPLASPNMSILARRRSLALAASAAQSSQPLAADEKEEEGKDRGEKENGKPIVIETRGEEERAEKVVPLASPNMSILARRRNLALAASVAQSAQPLAVGEKEEEGKDMGEKGNGKPIVIEARSEEERTEKVVPLAAPNMSILARRRNMALAAAAAQSPEPSGIDEKVDGTPVVIEARGEKERAEKVVPLAAPNMPIDEKESGREDRCEKEEEEMRSTCDTLRRHHKHINLPPIV